jgi:hypothetical protein
MHVYMLLPIIFLIIGLHYFRLQKGTRRIAGSSQLQLSLGLAPPCAGLLKFPAASWPVCPVKPEPITSYKSRRRPPCLPIRPHAKSLTTGGQPRLLPRQFHSFFTSTERLFDDRNHAASAAVRSLGAAALTIHQQSPCRPYAVLREITSSKRASRVLPHDSIPSRLFGNLGQATRRSKWWSLRIPRCCPRSAPTQ